MDLNDWGNGLADALGWGKAPPMRTALPGKADGAAITRAWLDAMRKAGIAHARLVDGADATTKRRLSRWANLQREADGLLDMLTTRIDEHPKEAQASLDAAADFMARYKKESA